MIIERDCNTFYKFSHLFWDPEVSTDKYHDHSVPLNNLSKKEYHII